MLSLQDHYAPLSICFGCGPANKSGLQIKSFVDQDRLVARWTPQSFHDAFPGVLNGGIVGALLDCHSNWASCWAIMNARQLEVPPCTVTAEFSVKLRRPTPTPGELLVIARPTQIDGDKVVVEASIEAGGKVTATCTGVFVAVREDHPAYHRW